MEANVTNTYTELYTMGGGKYLTQSYPTHFHTFHTRKMLTPTESASHYMEVTEAEKSALEAADAMYVRPPQAFIDRWNEAAGPYGRFNEATGYFELNGLTLTYEEALVVDKDSGNCILRDYGFMFSKARTFYELSGAHGGFSISTNRCFANCSNLEVLRVSWFSYIGNGAFSYCNNLRRVLGGINNISNQLKDCAKLEYAEIVLSQNLDLSGCPLLESNAFGYLFAHRRNGATVVTITVHTDVYAKLTDEDNAEWHALLGAAAENNIQFATA